MGTLKKPPVVEVWIGFDFDPNEKKRFWDLELVQRYVQRYASEMPKAERVDETQIQVQATTPTELPKVISQQQRLKELRIFDEQKLRVLKIGDDRISFHHLKSGDGYPGYAHVRDATLAKLKDYLGVFQPTRIRNAVIHYVDIVDIPRPPSGKIDVADYFVPSADVPETPFGPVADLSVRLVIACPVDDGPLFLQLRTLATPQESAVHRFRMDWQKVSTGVNTLDLAVVCTRLDVAHEYMTQCFQASLTKRTLALFEPIGED